DKILDRQGNLEWLKSHFAKSPLAGFVPPLFTIITIVEVSAGVLSGIGFLVLIFVHNPVIAFYGAVVAAIAILCLFFGLRMAKEYAGAAVLVPYFLVTLVAIYVLAQWSLFFRPKRRKRFPFFFFRPGDSGISRDVSTSLDMAQHLV